MKTLHRTGRIMDFAPAYTKFSDLAVGDFFCFSDNGIRLKTSPTSWFIFSLGEHVQITDQYRTSDEIVRLVPNDFSFKRDVGP